MEEKKKDLLIPASIVIAGILISVAVIYSSGKKSLVAQKALAPEDQTANILDVTAPSPKNLKPINKDDHIRGNKNARIKIVEFSDLECPFCKQFHSTLKKTVDAYGGKVAWVYRHLPLTSLHPKAFKEAEASECAAELGGEDAFWKFIDKVFEITPANNGLELSLLPQIAAEIGLDKQKFQTCLDSGRWADKINAHLSDAESSGARGTPSSVIIDEKSGLKIVVPGAVPFEGAQSLQSALDKLLAS